MNETGFDIDKSIFVAGHRGLVGSALVERLQQRGARQLILRSRDQLDLTDQIAVDEFFAHEKPDYVFLAAAKVGGIYANSTHPAEFIRDNLAIQTNVVHAAWKNGSRKLLFLGSSCIYPRDCPQPIREEYLLTGPLESTNEAYAIAKIAGLKMCQAYRRQYGFNTIVAMPTNLYGPHDNFHPENSHVVPGLIRRFHEAKLALAPQVAIWGTGRPMRELMHVDDLADALLLLMDRYDKESMVNVGSNQEISIAELARTIADVVGYRGEIIYDKTMPDGASRKLLDTNRLYELGWQARIPLLYGIQSVYSHFLASDQSKSAQ